jgi:hypothetical protein
MRFRAVVLLPLTVALLAFGAPMGSALAYPTTDTCATLSVSTTAPAAGERITVSGKNFDGQATVHLVYDTGANLRTVKSSSKGTFATSVRIPKSPGQHRITAKGGHSRQPSACGGNPAVALTVQGGAGGGGSAGAVVTSNGGGTAFTGTDIAMLLAIALALIALGVGLDRKARAGKRAASNRVPA